MRGNKGGGEGGERLCPSCLREEAEEAQTKLGYGETLINATYLRAKFGKSVRFAQRDRPAAGVDPASLARLAGKRRSGPSPLGAMAVQRRRQLSSWAG